MNLLTADIGSTYTKLTAIDLERQEIIATSSSFTTIETNVMEGFENALTKMKEQAGSIHFHEFYCCSSAAGGLKMVALGLVPELTSKAARLAAASAGAKVLKTYAFEISKNEQKEIEELNPDLVLLCGGTDGGNKEVIISNACRLAEIKQSFTIIVAGNKSASYDIENIFKAAGKSYVITENVMPEFNSLNIEPARAKITELFIDRIVEAKGLGNIRKLCNGDIIPTPLAVLRSCELLSKGTSQSDGVGDLLAIDLGGATTDVYSIGDGKPTMENVSIKGLPEPYCKRTVEGDLGMRYSLPSLVENAEKYFSVEDTEMKNENISLWINTVTQSPSLLANEGSLEKQIEQKFAKHAVKIAVERHVGVYQPVYTPFGQVFALTGKDLSEVKYVIGIGGAIIHDLDPLVILKGAQKTTNDHLLAKPKNPNYQIDKRYIFSSMGLICEKYPDLALKLMKQEIKQLSI